MVLPFCDSSEEHKPKMMLKAESNQLTYVSMNQSCVFLTGILIDFITVKKTRYLIKAQQIFRTTRHIYLKEMLDQNTKMVISVSDFICEHVYYSFML